MEEMRFEIDRARAGFSALQRAENSSIVGLVTTALTQARFSALQRAENSSIADDGFDHRDEFRFQCSSASRKFLNRAARGERYMHDLRFSALQRAENSSIPLHRQFRSVLEMFQCSSASRKFLNHTVPKPQIAVSSARFSALQRAENSSIKSVSLYADSAPKFQCSSASRKFLNRSSGLRMRPSCWVSVFFSEPKIPQCGEMRLEHRRHFAFQCSSASRKFLNTIA